MADGKALLDRGFHKCSVGWSLLHAEFACIGSGELENLDVKNETSEAATRSAFAWVTEAGYNPKIEGAFNHPWLAVEGHDEDNDASSAAYSTDVTGVSNGDFFIYRFLAEQSDTT